MYGDLCWYTTAHTQKGPNWIQNFSQVDRLVNLQWLRR